MPTYTLAQLRTLQLQATIAARLTAALSAAAVAAGKPDPVPNWAPAAAGGVEQSVVMMAAGTLASIVGPKLVAIAEGRFLDLATGDRLTAYAKSRYKLDRNLATYTIQNIRLLSTIGGTFAAGDLWVRGDGGNNYVSIADVVLEPNVPGDILFQAENTGASYSDAAGTVTRFVTAVAGLAPINIRRTDFADTALSGSSSGRVSAVFAVPGVPPLYDSIRVKVLTSGNLGTATFSYSTDGGATWVSPQPVGSTLTFTNGTNPSFIAGDVFTLIVADAIVERGTDDESDASLRDRCRARWPSLSDVPTLGLVRLWCHLASREVVRVRVDADANSPGGMLVTVASATGPASPQAQLAVQDYIAQRLRGFRGLPSSTVVGVGAVGSPEEHAQVLSATPSGITPGGVVSVARSKVAAVEAAADAAWSVYLGGVAIGGTVILPELIQAVMDAGAIDFQGATLNGSAQNVALGSRDVAVPADGVTLTNTLTWNPV